MPARGEQFVNRRPDAGLATSDHWRTRYALAQDVLTASGELRLVASGSSMLPALQAGDMLTFRCRRRVHPRVGQVVLYRYEGRLIAHRLRARGANGHWIIRGDSSPDRDDLPVADADLLGVLVGQQRGQRELNPDRTPRLLPYPLRWLMLRSRHANRVVARSVQLARA